MAIGWCAQTTDARTREESPERRASPARHSPSCSLREFGTLEIMSEPGRAPPSLSGNSSQSAGVKRPIDAEDLSSKAPKRPKSSKACLACRTQKTRCEPTAERSLRCHRCNRLNIECSFEKSPPPVILYAHGENSQRVPGSYGGSSSALDAESGSSAQPRPHGDGTEVPLVKSSTSTDPEGMEMPSYYITHPVTPTSPPRLLGTLKPTSLELATTAMTGTASRLTRNANTERLLVL
ncbi:hypothetical protein DL93DRAFT_528725 [Clavulina sp. PMI_390]|nr:hypothetical protein DL93DRAFT_528725 [Clavulina sp. PMI_390]